MNLKTLTTGGSKLLHILKYGERPRPLRDWLIVVSVTLTLLAASAGWSYWLFKQTSNANVHGAATPQSPQTKTASIETVKNLFDKRAVERARYLSEYRFVDPSR